MRGGLPPVMLRAQRSRFFCAIHQLDTTEITAGIVGAANNLQIPGDSDFRILRRAAVYSSVAAGQLKVQFEVIPGERFFDVPLFASALGRGGSPWPPFRQHRILPAGAQFRMIVDDRQTVAAAAALRVAHIGEKIFRVPQDPPRLYAEQRDGWYTADFTAQGIGAIGASATLPGAIQIRSDHDFQITHLVILCDSPEATLLIWSASPFHGWFSRACHASLLGATTFDADPPAGARPFILSTPLWLQAKATLSVEAADLSAAANRMQVIFGGFELRPPGGLPVTDELGQAIEDYEAERRGAAALEPAGAGAGAELRRDYWRGGR